MIRSKKMSRSCCPVLTTTAVLFCASCPGCIVVAVLSWPSYRDSPILEILTRRSCPGNLACCLVLTVLFRFSPLPVPGYLSHSVCPAFSVQFWLPCSSCPLPAVPSPSWWTCPVILSWMSCPCWPVISVLFCLSCPSSPVSLFCDCIYLPTPYVRLG